MGRWTIICLISFAVLLPFACTSEAAEQLVASSTATLKQTTTAGLGSSGFVTVWVADDGNNDLNIYARRYGRDGVAAGNAIRVNTYSEGSQSAPSVAVLAGGGFVIVWNSHGQDGSMEGVYGQRYNANGSPAGTEFRINTNIDFSQSNPEVIGLSGGGFAVVWQSPMTDYVNRWTDEIFARVFNASGEPLTDELQVNTVTTGRNSIFGLSDSQMNPAAAATSDGGFVVVWESYKELEGNNITKGIAGRRFSAGGSPLDQNEFAVNTTTPGDQEMPAVAPRQGGGFIAAWYAPDPEGSGGLEVYAQRFGGDGTKVGSEFRVNTYSNDNQIWPAVVLLGTGENLVAWYSNWQDGDSGGIYAQRIGADGNFAAAEFRVNTATAGYQHDHSLGVLPGGGWVAAWSSSLDSGASQTVSVSLPPLITAFSMPERPDVLQVPVTLSTANDNGVAGWCLTETDSPSSCDWNVSKPAHYLFANQGTHTLHAFVRDQNGNIGTAGTSTTVDLPRKTLTVTLSGTGGGSVRSDSGGITCPGICSATFDTGVSVQLIQAPDSNSVFGGWTGPCTITNGNCRVTMEADISVSATYVGADKARIGATPYTTLGAAFAAAAQGIVMARAIEFLETVNVNLPTIFKGGYNADFSSTGTFTILNGKLGIRGGSLKVSGLKIR